MSPSLAEQVRLQRALYLLKIQEEGEKLMKKVITTDALLEEQAKLRDMSSPILTGRKRSVSGPSTGAPSPPPVEQGASSSAPFKSAEEEEAKQALIREARRRALERAKEAKLRDEAVLARAQEEYLAEQRRRAEIREQSKRAMEAMNKSRSARRRERKRAADAAAAEAAAAAAAEEQQRQLRAQQQKAEFEQALQSRYSEIIRRMRSERDAQEAAARDRAERLRKARERPSLSHVQPAVPRPDTRERDAQAAAAAAATSRLEQAVIKAQSLWRMQRQRRAYLRELSSRIRQRAAVARELCETEQRYCHDLETVVELYIKRFREKHILSESDIRVLFGNLEEILPVNKLIRDELTARISQWTQSSKIGDFLKKTAPYLKTYAPYCRNYQAALQLLGRLRSRGDFAAVLAEAEQNPRCNGLTLVSFLIMPIQRIPRYELLLKELIKATNRDHPDYADLEEALAQIHTAAQFVNEEIRSSERMWKVMAIQQRLTGKFETLVQPSRKFVKEGALQEKYNGKGPKLRYFFLFNDAIVCAAKNTLAFAFGEFEFKYLQDLGSIKHIEPAVEDPDLPFAFRLEFGDGLFIVLGAESNELRHEWVREIIAQKESAKRRIRHSGLSGLSG